MMVGGLVGFSTLGIRDFSLFERSRSDEIADRHSQLLGCFHNFCGFLFRAIGEQGFSYGRMQAAASDGRTFAHTMDVSKSPPSEG